MRRGRRLLLYILLVLLLIINAYLLFALWQGGNATAIPAPQSTGTSGATPFESPPGNATPTALSSSTPPPPSKPPRPSDPISSVEEDFRAIPTKRLLVAATAREAWRATVGDCKTPGKIERSTDSGKSWKRTVRTGLAPIVRLGIEGQGNLYTVGGRGPNCSTRYIAYSRSGDVVGQTAAPQGVWFLDPGNSDRVIGPRNTKATPCKKQQVVSLAAVDDLKAVVICTDGSVVTTSNAGGSWKKIGNLPGTMTVATVGGRYWAAGFAKSCDGVVVRSLGVERDHLSPGTSRCAKRTKATASQVALGGAGNTIWLWVADKVWVSTNGGRSWT